MSDCLWGLLDGMNDAGLAVSLTFGGRACVGDGFGIPLVVRYLLETCATVAEARAALDRVPVNLAHNLTLVDRARRGGHRAARRPTGAPQCERCRGRDEPPGRRGVGGARRASPVPMERDASTSPG